MSQLSSGNPSIKLSIPQERQVKDIQSNHGLIPQSIVERKIQQQRKNFQDKGIQIITNFPQNENEKTQTHLEINSQISPITQQHVTIDFQNHDIQQKQNNVNRQKSQDDPFSVPELIENEKTAAANHSSECKKENNSFHSMPKLNFVMNDSSGPKVVLSKFAIRKNEYNLTHSIQQNGNSNPNKSNNTNSKDDQMYSVSQGWMHSQFNPQLDNNFKKEMYVISKMVEFQFDPVIAKQVIEQIDIEKYSREEIVQMVCETMLNHCEEQRIGKRVIDKINQSKFVHKLVSSKANSQVNNAGNNTSVALQIPTNQQNQNPKQKGNTSILHSFNNKNQNSPISNNNIFQKDGKDRQNKGGKKTAQNINSYIFNMPITHSQKFIKIENNVQDKDEGKLYPCEICCQEFLGSEFYRLTHCSHNFCMQCIQTYIINKINCSEVLNIVCPQASCGVKIQDLQIQKVISPDLFEKYMRFKKIMVLNQDPNIRWCPTVDCETFIRREDKEKICLSCPKCSQKICFLCNSKWHEGTCEDAMNQSLIQMKEKLQIKQCPKCKGRIQKFDGCNHMKCWICSYEFCWLCKKQYSKWHYRTWNIIGCPDQMFSDEEIEGFDKVCLFVSSLLRLIFLVILVLLGGSTALVIYTITMFGMALVLPILITYNYFKLTIEKLSDTQKCFLWLFLLALGVFLYPLWLFLCFIPGTCIFGPEIYMYILFLIYNEDMYR